MSPSGLVYNFTPVWFSVISMIACVHMPNFLGEHGGGKLSTPTTKGSLKLLELTPPPFFFP